MAKYRKQFADEVAPWVTQLASRTKSQMLKSAVREVHALPRQRLSEASAENERSYSNVIDVICFAIAILSGLIWYVTGQDLLRVWGDACGGNR